MKFIIEYFVYYFLFPVYGACVLSITSVMSATLKAWVADFVGSRLELAANNAQETAPPRHRRGQIVKV